MYEGDNYVTAGVANLLKNKLRECILVPGVSAHIYIEGFMELYTQIQKHERFTLNIIEMKKNIKNIRDDDFANFSASMQYGMKTSSLEELQKNRFYEQDIEKSTSTSNGQHQSSNKVRQIEQQEDKNEPNEPLPSRIETGINGTCSIKPDIWHSLSRSSQELVLKYNAYVRLNTKLSSLPEGATIVASPRAQPTNNTAGRKRRARSSDYIKYGSVRVHQTEPSPSGTILTGT